MTQRHPTGSATALQVVQDGDLVVARKADSALDQLIALTDDPFHHIGMVVCRTVHGVREPWVVEHTFAGCTTRRLHTFFDHYEDVGVLFLDLTTSERRRLRDTALSYLGTTPRYAWDEVFLAGIYALVRHRRGTKTSLRRCRVMKAVEAAIHRRNQSAHRAMFCTTFVLQVFADSETATPKQLGALAPPDGSCHRGISPTVLDHMMRWAIPFQMAAGIVSLVVLLLSAVTHAFSHNLDRSPAMFSPSDYWRHAPAQLRWERRAGQNSAESAPRSVTPALALGRMESNTSPRKTQGQV